MSTTCAKIVSIISKHWVQVISGPSADAYKTEDDFFYKTEDGNFYLIE